MSWDEGHAAWMELEELLTMTRAADGTCRKCGRADCLGPLCASCEERRKALYKGFGGRPVSRRAPYRAARRERMPYKDSGDTK